MRTLLLILCLSVVACQRQSHKMVADESMAPVQQTSAEETPPESPPTQQIIKTADYRFQVENVDKSTKNIETLVTQNQALITNMDQRTTSNEISNTLVIRVPSSTFEKLLNDLGKEAIFTNYKTIKAEDVTQEFVDIETRLKTKKEVRDRYIDILRNKAKTVDEVLKAEEQIRVLQEEIESREGRLRYLQSRVSMSTINLELYQRVDYKEIPGTYEKPYLTKVKEGFSNGWSIVTSFSLVIVNIWPLLIIAILAFWKRKWIKERLTGKG